MGFARLDSDDLSDEQQMLDLEMEDRHALGGSEPPFGARRAFLLVAVNIGFNFNSFLQLVVIVPSRLAELAGDAHKGQAVGSVLLCAGLVSIFAAPPIGSLSDRMPWSPRLGRRAPLILLGAVLGALTNAMMLRAATVGEFALWYSLLTVASLLTSVPFNALTMDVVPADARGFASGAIGSAQHGGNLIGALVSLRYAEFSPGALAALMAAMLVGGALVTALGNREPPPPPPPPRAGAPVAGGPLARAGRIVCDYLSPLIHHADFRWVFITRLLMQQGVYTVQEFLLYWMQDMVVRPAGVGAARAVGIAMLLLLAAALVAAGAGGRASDAMGGRRKAIVYGSGACMAAASLVGAAATAWPLALCVAFFFGLGYGAFLAVDYALVLDVLPSAADSAKDLAVWHASLVLPQLMATPIAGGLLDHFQRGAAAAPAGSFAAHLGYSVVFWLATAYFVLATVLVRRIKKVR